MTPYSMREYFGLYGSRYPFDTALSIAKLGWCGTMALTLDDTRAREIGAHVPQLFYHLSLQFLRANETTGLRKRLEDEVTHNNWWLRDAAGEIVTIEKWGHAQVVDFSNSTCVSRFIDLIDEQIETWQRFSGPYHGIIFEVLAEKVPPLWFTLPASKVAPWGANTRRLAASVIDTFPRIVGGDAAAPSMAYFNGIKIEDLWNRFEPRNAGAQAWHDEFDGLKRRNRGLLLSKQDCGAGRYTLLDMEWHDWTEAEFQRRLRMTVAAALLTDKGIAMINPCPEEPAGSPQGPWLIDEMGWDFGQPKGDCAPEGVGWHRTFERGDVEIELHTETVIPWFGLRAARPRPPV